MWYWGLVARYNEEAGSLVVGDRCRSSWWWEVARIRDDPWLGGVPLSARFRRLFELSTYQTSSVAYMCALGWEEGGAPWQWRRPLWAWEEEMLGECMGFLVDIILQ
ncbi:receptor-like kinase, partial [Trifolium medium]|nr:receptor-like kinase [Trifolium medium]